MDGLSYDSTSSSCKLPYDAMNYTISHAYYFYGFSLQSGWSVSSGASSYSCTQTTIVGRASMTISKSFSSLQTHWAARVMFAHYIQDSTSFNNNIRISYDGGTTYNDVGISVNMLNAFNPSIHCTSSNYLTIQNYIDESFTHTASTLDLRITTSGGVVFGIREFILIIKRCNNECSSCTGY